jgi:hypothetical protein
MGGGWQKKSTMSFTWWTVLTVLTVFLQDDVFFCRKHLHIVLKARINPGILLKCLDSRQWNKQAPAHPEPKSWKFASINQVVNMLPRATPSSRHLGHLYHFLLFENLRLFHVYPFHLSPVPEP